MYPALAVLQELAAEEIEVLWVGGQEGMEQDLVSRAGYQITTLPAAGLHGVGLRALPGNLLKIWQGSRVARCLLNEFRPDALFFTGGFVAAPVALVSGKIPTVAFVPDIKPGFALRLVARFADRIALVAEDAKQYFGAKKRLVVTGYPVRNKISAWERTAAQNHFGLDPQFKTLLVFGGSKGARSINLAVAAALPQLLEQIQILHVTGQANWRDTEAELPVIPAKLQKRYRAFPYLHDDMGAALAAADLVLSRAGASTIGEFPLFGLPAILVPIPMKGHIQHLNAAYLKKFGAVLLLPDEQMSEKLSQLVLDTMYNEQVLAGLSQAMQSLAHRDAARAIADLILDLGQTRQKEVAAL